ncbi:MAG TPA: hypothetical protein VHZ04_03915 [Candidatus Paceibacterota bacterium]|jgi:hypothetical protein|nr:hypothetical protein [Candidatus Paceibacterota bacterium]
MAQDMLGNVVRNLVNVPEEALGTLIDLTEKLASDPKWLPAVKKTLRMENPWDGAKISSEGDSFRGTGELSIKIPAQAQPSLREIQKRFSWVKKIERDNSPTKELTLKLVTVLREGEECIDGNEYERRIAPRQDIILGYQQAVWLEEHQDEFPEFMALLGKVYIDFSGLVVVDGDGSRSVFYLDQGDRRWRLDFSWFSHDFGRYERVASSCK